MTTFDTGRKAEAVAAEFLTQQKYEVLAQNWRTKTCEIDVVVRKDDAIYFVEVKYRKSDRQGGGLEYITPKKVKHMQYAAELWISKNNWDGDYQLAAIEVGGEPPRVLEYVDEIY
jgi:uncharacterized protein (TIGR00252 family)